MQHQRSASCESEGRKLAAAFYRISAVIHGFHLEALPTDCKQGIRQRVTKLYATGKTVV